jgi:alpha-1,6-mannosyltransferase
MVAWQKPRRTKMLATPDLSSQTLAAEPVRQLHIVDISALYSPNGGGIRTYTRAKLAMAEQYGIRMTVVAPGPADGTQQMGSARLIMVKSPRFPLDRNYSYFADEAVIHAMLDRLAPDFIECSSPWGSAVAVGNWPGAAPRALVMHAEPMSAWVYRYLDRVLPRPIIDRGFAGFWRYMQRLDRQYQLVVAASGQVAARLSGHGLANVALHPLGIEAGVFSPEARDEALRAALLAGCGLPPSAVLALGVGRHSPEKQWPLVVDAATAAGQIMPLALVLLGDGPGRAAVERAIDGNPHIRILPPVTRRPDYARLLASADLLVHGCAAETFGLACAEAAACGLPMIVPDDGGALDQLRADAGTSYRANSSADLRRALLLAADQLPAWRLAAATPGPAPRTMADHFGRLFQSYRAVHAGWARGNRLPVQLSAGR